MQTLSTFFGGFTAPPLPIPHNTYIGHHVTITFLKKYIPSTGFKNFFSEESFKQTSCRISSSSVKLVDKKSYIMYLNFSFVFNPFIVIFNNFIYCLLLVIKVFFIPWFIISFLLEAVSLVIMLSTYSIAIIFMHVCMPLPILGLNLNHV